jgi:hypothetical protein
VSNKDLEAALKKEGVSGKAADQIVDTNEQARITGLRSALALLAFLPLLALLFTGGIPKVQPGAQAREGPVPAEPASVPT